MSKNVAVFVDVANIFYAAKAAGVDIDYVTLLKASTAGRDFVRAYAYTGLDPENENQRNFHSFLARSGYKVVSKDIRKYGDGKVKANLDIELVVDLMKTARNLDIAVVVSGDGDFAPAIRAVQETGVRVEVVSFRGNTSSDLIEVADVFTDITQIAKVEKGSTRSGRRVASGDEDLSMTEVPEKESEGAGRRRRGGRRTTEPAETPAAAGRSRRGRRTTEPAEAPAAAERSRRGRRTAEPAETTTAAAAAGLVVLPGEKLARAAAAPGDEEAAAEEIPEETAEVAAEGEVAEGEVAEGEGTGRRRRRRRRGGRGRGRGRADEQPTEGEEPSEGEEPFEGELDEEEAVVAPTRAPRPGAFGSIWDSQIGVPTTPAGEPGPIDEDFEEPEIPEYLIAERRQGGRSGGRGRGPRGGRSAYVAAMERERYGRGGGTRLPQPTARPVPSSRPSGGPGGRRGGSGSAEPWSEVPPELEAMIRAQAAQKPAAPRTDVEPPAESQPDAPAAAAEAPKPRTRRTSRPKAAEPTAAAGTETEAPKPRTRRTSRTKAAETVEAGATEAPKPRTRRTSRTKAAETVEAGATEAPKPRTRRTKAAETAQAGDAEAPKPRTRRTSRTTTEPSAEG